MSEENLERLLIMIEKCIPKNNLINGIMMLLRIFPLFLLTHDLNIHYKNSISYYFSIYTTLPLIHKTHAHYFSTGLIIFLFIFSLINIFLFFKFYRQIKEFHKITKPKFFKYTIQIIFWINFVFAPFNFMFCAENFFCTPVYDETSNYKLIKSYRNDCRNFSNIFLMIIQFILLFYLIIVNTIFSILISKPCCLSSSLIITKLNEIKFKLAFFPFFQSFLVLDYHLPLKICVLIKSLIRALYIWYYISFISSETKNFFTNFNYRISIVFIDSMCFFSCIIEYFFILDYKNNFQYLQKNGTIMLFKLLIEATLSFTVIHIFCINEVKITIQFFNGKIENKYSYELLNKIFYVFYHPEKVIGTDILYEIIESFDTIFKIHKSENECSKYPGIKCYCTKYTYNDFVKQSENYLDIVNGIRIGKKFDYSVLKKNFPIMYKYIETNIKIHLLKNKGGFNNENYLLVLAFFYILFDKNYNKGLFYIEEFSTSKLYSSNKLIRFQCKLIKLVILDDYNDFLIYNPEKLNKLIPENSFQGIYKIYTKISEVIVIENFLENTLKVYIDSLNYFKDKDCSFNEFIQSMRKFKRSIKKMNKSLINIFGSNIITSYHLCAKLTLFYSFFYLELPKKINMCFKNIFEITCKYENFSCIIVNTINTKNSWKFTFEYASDNFCSELGYTLHQLKNKEVNELNPDGLKKCYDYNALEKIRLGNNKIILNEYIFLNKNKHACLYDLVGIVIFDGDKLKLFFKIYPYNFKSPNILNNIKKNDKSKNKKDDNNLNKAECFAFINKNGKVIAISKLFEEYFCLTFHSIKKYKINLIKDILKIENIDGREIIKKNLSQVYENIANLNFNLMQNSSNEEFTKTYKHIREIQKHVLKNINSYLVCINEEREIPKNNREMKNYYFICFHIEVNNVFTIFENFLENIKSTNNNYFIFPSKTKIGEFVNSLSHKKRKELPKKFEMNNNQNEILIKIRQIQILSMKQLLLNYNIRISEILDLTLKEEEEFNAYNNIVDRETSRLMSANSNQTNNSSKNHLDSIDNYDKFFRNRAIDEPYILERKRNYSYCLKIKIYLLILIWILLTFIVIFLQCLILYISKSQLKVITTLSEILKNSLITKNIIYSFITTLICMQYVANNLNNDTVIDNGFVNTIPFHKQRIYVRVRDFLYYFKIFERQEKFLCDYNEIEAINIFFEELDYINVKADDLIERFSLNSILSNSHLRAYEVIHNTIEPFLFNISYDEIPNRKLLGESAFFQFVFDNYFCNGKYAWDEVENIIYLHIETKSSKKLYLIYIISVISGILVCGFFIIQFFFFTKFINQIYARYYLNYNYLQFFNSLLLKKANLIKEFLNNTNIESLYNFSQQKLTFEDNLEDNNIFKNNYLRTNNKMPLIIKAYDIKEIITKDNIKLGINKSNSIFVTPNNESIISPKINITTVNINQNIEILNDIHVNYIFDPPLEKTENNKLKSIMTSSKSKTIKKSKKTKKSSELNKTIHNPNNNTLSNNHLLNENNFGNTLNLLNNELNKINSKKDLSKPKQFMLYLIFFSITIVSLTIFFILNDIMIKSNFNTNILFTYTLKTLIDSINNTMEIFLIYSIILLKGDVITFKYKSHGYLSIYNELNYLNDIEEHNIIEEVFEKNDIITLKVENILNKHYNYFIVYNEYLEKMNSPDSCEFYINFYFKNKGTYDYSFLNAFNYDADELIKECYNLTNGINSQGISLAVNSLITTIKSQYYEFKEDNERGKNLYARANNEKFISAILETDLVFDKLIINLIICWAQDTKNAQTKIDTWSYIVFSLIIIIIFFVFITYIILFPIKTLNENEVINFVEPCYYNTIMF